MSRTNTKRSSVIDSGEEVGFFFLEDTEITFFAATPTTTTRTAKDWQNRHRSNCTNDHQNPNNSNSDDLECCPKLCPTFQNDEGGREGEEKCDEMEIDSRYHLRLFPCIGNSNYHHIHLPRNEKATIEPMHNLPNQTPGHGRLQQEQQRQRCQRRQHPITAKQLPIRHRHHHRHCHQLSQMTW